MRLKNLSIQAFAFKALSEKKHQTADVYRRNFFQTCFFYLLEYIFTAFNEQNHKQ